MRNVTSNVASKSAFFLLDPPHLGTYAVYRDEEEGKLAMIRLSPDKHVDVHLLETKGGNKVTATIWRHPTREEVYVVVFKCPTDLGKMLGSFSCSKFISVSIL
ncbi:alpha/beta-Hydrolases superfamily protein [Perilla frutescens var. hirtella]|nr:alpha/beta-Hydrolases superfamily protein [Perilla frutescens var. hirtella]KAH6811468.1 alpha/beta-Hydrolases superfamily protein [Perilla frutescens var. frutescens]